MPNFNLEELLIFIVSFLVFAAVVVDVIRIRIKLLRVSRQLKQSEVDKIIYLGQLAKMTIERESQSVEQTDGFLKFVSESRDWAFKYIEDVQDAIKQFDEAMSSSNAKQINEAYKKLIGFLPKDDVVK